MLITPIWANMGVYGLEDTEKVDHGRIGKFMCTAIGDFTASSMRSNRLTFDLLTIIDQAVAPSTVAPTLQMIKFDKTCIISAGFFPLHQDIGIAKLRRS